MLSSYSPKVGSAIAGTILLTLAGNSTRKAEAQITPDNTLGAEKSVVTPGVNVRGAQGDRIDGGARRGGMLFHSFDQFGVEALQRVYFSNPAGVENILSRVTGNDPSRIMGTLGVDGGANLFLINPRGIVFGPNARLDISGAFVASTAESLNFGDNLEFSATNPNAPPLLTVSIRPGVQLGNMAPGSTLTNQGILQAGKDLTLAADKLDLQGQLQAGENLTLQATNTVKIRDSVEEPFLARSGGDLLIQGNQGIDILALNHPTLTPFISGKNLNLISNGTISGDAHYESGGNFSIQNTSGETNNFFSLYDPIITSDGNVTFGTYTGPSLKVVAAGSISANSITINGIDPALGPTQVLILEAGKFGTNDNQPFPQTPNPPGNVPFDKTLPAALPGSITINGQISTPVEPLNVTLSATGPITLRQVGGFSIATRGGSITIDTPGALTVDGSLSVRRDSTEKVGDISIGTNQSPSSITVSTISTRNIPSPSINRDPDNNILPDGGNITIKTTGAFRALGAFDASTPNGIQVSPNPPDPNWVNPAPGNPNIVSIASQANSGKSGNISITAGGAIILAAGISSASNFSGKGGSITLEGQAPDNAIAIDTRQGVISSRNLHSTLNADGSTNPDGIGGNITLIAKSGDIRVGDLNAESNNNNFPNNLGPFDTPWPQISLQSETGSVYLDGVTVSAKNTGNQISADIFIDADQTINVSNSVISTDGNFGFLKLGTRSSTERTIIYNSTLSSQSNDGQSRAGDIEIVTGTIKIDGNKIDGKTIRATANGNSSAGNIRISAKQSPSTSGTSSIDINNATIENTVEQGNNDGRQGKIEIIGPSITLANSTINASTKGQSAGGSILLEATSGEVEIKAGSDVVSKVEGAATGKGGDITIKGGSVSIVGTGSNNPESLEGTQINADLASNTTNGIGGNIFIAATNPTDGKVAISNGALITTQISGTGTGTSRTGGSIFIGGATVTNSITGNTSSDTTIQTSVAQGATGNAGNITIGEFALPDGTSISTSVIDLSRIALLSNANGTGNSGKIDIVADQTATIADSSIRTTANSTNGEAGDLRIQAGQSGSADKAITLDNVYIDIAAFGGNGKTGSLEINAINKGNIDLVGGNTIFTDIFGVKSADNILTILGGNILIDDYRLVATVNSNGTAGGNVLIEGTTIEIRGNSEITTQTFSNRSDGLGNGGSITLQTNGGNISLKQGVLSSTVLPGSTGNGGDITVDSLGGAITIGDEEAGTTFRIDATTQSTDITANSTQKGKGGSIAVRSGGGAIAIVGNSTVDASTSGTKNGGTVSILSEGGTIQLREGSIKTTVGATASGDGGDITIDGASGTISIGTTTTSFEINAGTQAFNTHGSQNENGKGGNIAIATQNGVLSIVKSTLTAQTDGTKNGGDVAIDVGLGEVTLDNSTIKTTATQSGNAGNIEVIAQKKIVLEKNSALSAASQSGVGGNLTLSSRQLTLDNSSISASTQTGKAGQLMVEAEGGAADFIRLIGQSELSLSASNNGSLSGNAGAITLNAKEVTLQGTSPTKQAKITATTTSGNGQDISLENLETLTITDGEISASTDRGIAGSILLNQNSSAAANVTLTNSQLSVKANQAAPSGFGNAGDILLNTRQLTLNDSSISASTQTGKAGNLTVEAQGNAADSIRLFGKSELSLSAADNSTLSGTAGSITLNTQQLTLQGNSPTEKAKITATTTSGEGKDILLKNVSILTLTNGEISASTSTGTAGDLVLNKDGMFANNVTLVDSKIGVEATQAAPTGKGNAGNVLLNTRNLALTNSLVSASTVTGSAGDIIVNAPGGIVQLQGAVGDGPGGLLAQATGEQGSAGNVVVNASQVAVQDKAQISTSSTNGISGDVVLEGLSTLQLNNGRIAAATVVGQAGNFTLNQKSAAAAVTRLSNNSLLAVAATGDRAGKAGFISLNTRQLVLQDNSAIAAFASGNGQAGSVTIDSADLVEVNSGSQISVQGSDGVAGNVVLNASDVKIQNGGQILASNQSAQPADGTELLFGNIVLNRLNSLEMDNGTISASTATGRAGSVVINAPGGIVEMSNGSLLSVQATNGGSAGSLILNTNQLQVNSGSKATVSSEFGQAGNLIVTTNSLRLDQGQLTAVTGGTGESGANISINVPDETLNPVILRNGSLIAADAKGAANGGNITIKAPFIIAIPQENSDITANAEQGNGGKVEIDSFGVFGLQFRRKLTPYSDITASSEFGREGLVEIQTLDIDPSKGLSTLPVVPVDPSQRISQQCTPGAAATTGRFTTVGRGGLPPAPEEALSSDTIWEDLPIANIRVTHLSQQISQIEQNLQPPRGFYITCYAP